MLKRLLQRQAELQELIGVESQYRYGEGAAKEHVLALIVEATEVLDELNWKHWHKNKKVVNKIEIAKELADCLQFIGNIANALDISSAMLEAAVNHKQDQTQVRFRDTPIDSRQLPLLDEHNCWLCCDTGWVGPASIHIDDPACDPGLARCPNGCEVPE